MKCPFHARKAQPQKEIAEVESSFSDEKQVLWKSAGHKLALLGAVACATELACYATAVTATLAASKRVRWSVPAVTGIVAVAGIAATAFLANRTARSIETIDVFEETLIDACGSADVTGTVGVAGVAGIAGVAGA